jgi:hypothetical protein
VLEALSREPQPRAARPGPQSRVRASGGDRSAARRRSRRRATARL